MSTRSIALSFMSIAIALVFCVVVVVGTRMANAEFTSKSRRDVHLNPNAVCGERGGWCEYYGGSAVIAPSADFYHSNHETIFGSEKVTCIVCSESGEVYPLVTSLEHGSSTSWASCDSNCSGGICQAFDISARWLPVLGKVKMERFPALTCFGIGAAEVFVGESRASVMNGSALGFVSGVTGEFVGGRDLDWVFGDRDGVLTHREAVSYLHSFGFKVLVDCAEAEGISDRVAVFTESKGHGDDAAVTHMALSSVHLASVEPQNVGRWWYSIIGRSGGSLTHRLGEIEGGALGAVESCWDKE